MHFHNNHSSLAWLRKTLISCSEFGALHNFVSSNHSTLKQNIVMFIALTIPRFDEIKLLALSFSLRLKSSPHLAFIFTWITNCIVRIIQRWVEFEINVKVQTIVHTHDHTMHGTIFHELTAYNTCKSKQKHILCTLLHLHHNIWC